MNALRRMGTGDALIGLALIALVLAGLLPTYRARAFDRALGEAVAEVDALVAAAQRRRATTGDWPEARPAGRVPSGAASIFEGDSTMVRDAYTLEWSLLDRVAYVEAPPRPSSSGALFDDDEVPTPPQGRAGDAVPDSATVEMMATVRTEGVVMVHSADELLLAELLRRYGPERSFVRDATWTLVVPPSQG